MMNHRKWIASTIKNLRASKDMTLANLAEATGLSISYISDIERERTVPTIETLNALLVALGTSLYLDLETERPRQNFVISRENFNALAKVVDAIRFNDGMCHCEQSDGKGARCGVCGGYLF